MSDFSEQEIERLKFWAQWTEADVTDKLKEAAQTPEYQEGIKIALQPLMAELERAFLQAFEESDGADAKKIAEKISDNLTPKLQAFEKRLQRLEAQMFRLLPLGMK